MYANKILKPMMMEYYKVADLCHYTGKYQSSPRSILNLRCRIPKKVPVVFCNGLKYDYHLPL